MAQSIDWQGCSSSNRFSETPYWEGGVFWYNETAEGDRFGYNVYRTLDEQTHILLTRFQSSRTYASSSYLAVRRGEMIDWSSLSNPPRRSITTLARLGEVVQVDHVDALVRDLTAK